MNNQFIGTYYHTLEEKGRVSVPKKFRSTLKKGGVITHGLDGCLFIFPQKSWQKLTGKLANLPLSQKAARDFLRLLTYNATELELDDLGRTRIPDNLQDLGDLKKEVVFAGALTRVELWAKTKYHSYLESIGDQQKEIEKILGELGI